MARNRNKESNVATATENMFTPIEDENALADILAGARGRGDYKEVLTAVIESGHRLVQIPLDRGVFEGKKATTVKTGFENAKSSKNPPEGADQVKVVKKNDQVYLINQAVSA